MTEQSEEDSSMGLSAPKTYQATQIPPPSSQQLEAIMAKLDQKGGVYGVTQSEQARFYEDALRLVDASADAPYSADFFKLRPTYASLTEEQRMGYFTWRTRARAGDLTHAPSPFYVLYCYELINLVGVDGPEDAYARLTDLANSSHFPIVLRTLLREWRRDFIVYYDLDKNLLNKIFCDRHMNDGCDLIRCTPPLSSVLPEHESELFTLLTSFSSYTIEKSPFFADASAALRSVICRVVTRLWDRHAKIDSAFPLFGVYYPSAYTFFRGALFYERSHSAKKTRVLPNGDRYEYRDNRWWLIQWFPERRSAFLTNLFRSCESRLRRAYGYKRSLKAKPLPEPAMEQVIDEEIARYLRESRVKKTPTLTIDRSKLEAIRTAAFTTQQKLLVESEDVEPVVQEESVPEEPVVVRSPAPDSDSPRLTSQEQGLLSRILQDPASVTAKTAGISLELFADAVNEKLFDLVNDTVLVVDEGHIEIIPDYRTQVQALIQL